MVAHVCEASSQKAEVEGPEFQSEASWHYCGETLLEEYSCAVGVCVHALSLVEYLCTRQFDSQNYIHWAQAHACNPST